jgi:hypothetical protein
MDAPVMFTITLEDLVDSQRLSSRKVAIASGVLMLWGIGLAAVGVSVGIVAAIIALLALLEWRFPTLDRWLLRRRFAARIGAVVEFWTDERGIEYRQTGFSGHIDWATITSIKEDDRTLKLMQGGITLMGIPKRAFGSPEAAAAFVAEVRRGAGL